MNLHDFHSDLLGLIFEETMPEAFCVLRRACKRFSQIGNVITKKCQYIASKQYMPWDWAAEYGHLDLMEWLYHNKIPGCDYGVSVLAVRNCHKHIIRFLLDNGLYDNSGSDLAMLRLICSDNVDMLTFLHDNKIGSFDAERFDWAATGGNFEVIKLFHRFQVPFNGMEILTNVIHSHNLDIIKYVYENELWDYSDDESTDPYYVFGCIIGNGKVKIAKYLLSVEYVRIETYSEYLGRAVSSGKIKMVKYILTLAVQHDNKDDLEYNTSHSFSQAATLGHLDIMYLLEPYVPCVPGSSLREKLNAARSDIHDPISGAAYRSDLVNLKFFCENMTLHDDVYECILNNAKDSHNSEMVTYIESLKPTASID